MKAGPLLSTSQLESVQSLALRGMTTPVTILRRTVSTPILASDDYGDDEVTYAETRESRRTVVKGWFYSRPTSTIIEDTGQIVTANTYRLYLPVGTDILAGDEVSVGTDTYIVVDTTAESTWPALLNVSLRKTD